MTVNQSDQRKLAELAKRIRRAREGAHISQLELGKAIGVSDKAISSYERGRSIPPFNKLKKIAQATEQPMDYFSGDPKLEATIVSKLSKVEKELAEIKKLLKKAS